MKSYEFIIENVEKPKILYHGTPGKNIPGIFSTGLTPRLNKYAYKTPGAYPDIKLDLETKAEETAISCTADIQVAIDFANQGGGMTNVWMGSKEIISRNRGVVLAFEVLPADKIVAGGYMGEEEWRVYSKIDPSRLKVVHPKVKVGKEKEYTAKGKERLGKKLSKTEVVKATNKALKAAGIDYFRIKSIGTPNRPRVRLIDPTRYGSSRPKDFDYLSDEFKQFVKDSLSRKTLANILDIPPVPTFDR